MRAIVSLLLLLPACTIDLDVLSFECSIDADCARGTLCHALDRVCAVPLCGDGSISAGEACDDGGTQSGDGCGATCALEPGATCDGMPSSCSLCGDRRHDPREACDDGDRDDGDGCDALCRVEEGFTCDDRGCGRCGDGIRASVEACDDGGASGGCNACRVGFGYTCTGTVGQRSTCTSPRFVAVAAGSRHTCAIDAAGAVTCIGKNDASETDPRITGQATPPSNLPPLRAIGAGKTHTCGIARADDRVICWGPTFAFYESADHEVGLSTVPRDLGPVRELAVGHIHTCAVRMNGTIRCWGANQYGQTSPVPAVAAHAVTVGSFHACAIRDSDSRAICWGLDDNRIRAPDHAFTALAIGAFHTCGVIADSTLRCWDRTETPPPRSRPPGGAGFVSVELGHYYSCALDDAGRVACFGETPEAADVLAAPDDRFVAISGGNEHVCGLREDGSVLCWGNPAGYAE